MHLSERCRYFPNCTNPNCQYVHPSTIVILSFYIISVDIFLIVKEVCLVYTFISNASMASIAKI